MLRNDEVQNAVGQLDSAQCEDRLESLQRLCQLCAAGNHPRPRVAPHLPSYDHVHTRVSYGHTVPGVYSVSHTVWAAHAAGARCITIIEHESLQHISEAREAVKIVNRYAAEPMMLVLGVEFKAPVDVRRMPDPQSDLLRAGLEKLWGQNEAAWVVGMGVKSNPQLQQMVQHFQQAKRSRAAVQLDLLNEHLQIKPPMKLEDALTPQGNITDRGLSWAVARAKYGKLEDAALAAKASEIRKMLNPGGPAHCPFPKDLPSYAEVVRCLAQWNMLPSFTAQLRNESLEKMIKPLHEWGIRGLDVAGIEPDDPNAQQHVQQMIRLAEKHDLALFAGSDYRGTGTGWTTAQPWMSHPRVIASLRKMVC